jgi:hypothetical protein
LCRLEGNGSFGSALRTDCPGFSAYATAGSGYTLDFALLAPLWIVLELLIVKEQLLTSGKDKVITAIRTLQYLVDEVHTRPPEHALEFFSIPVDQAPDWHRLTNQLLRLAIRQLSSHSEPGNERGNGAKPLYKFLKSAGLPAWGISGLPTPGRHLQG